MKLKFLLTILVLIPSLSWGNSVILNCTPKEYKMFDGISFNENNLTDEDLNSISFIMIINKPMKYIEIETTSGFKRKFSIENNDNITNIYAAGVWSDQEYTILVDNLFNYEIDIKFKELHSFDYGSCINHKRESN